MSTPGWLPETALAGALFALVSITLRIIALGVIPGNRRPSSGMAWLLLILLAPVAGFGVFLLFGRTHLEKRRSGRQHEATRLISDRAHELLESYDTSGAPAFVGPVATLNARLGSLPLVAGNRIEVLPDYGDSIATMTKAVEEARSHVHVEFYITAWDEVTGPFFAALEAAVARGVEVRLLFDHLGSRGIPGYKEMVARLATTGIVWHPMMPFQPLHGKIRRPDLRNHRKLLVVDDAVGFTGSQNMTEPGYNKPKNHEVGREWVELMSRLEGPVVAQLAAVFASDWYAETGERLGGRVVPIASAAPDADVAMQIVPSGPGFAAENNLRLFTTLLYSATERISLTSPYFVPDESLLYAVTTAALRGVDVELFVSEEADQFMVGHAQASYYRALLEAGVKIWLYPAPYVLHSKHFTIDDEVAVLGSSNMDMRSFALNYEISLMMIGSATVARMRTVEDTYREKCRLLTLEEWKDRPARTRYVDNVMRLTAALQ